MKDPLRLLEDGALSDLERRSLLAGRAAGPPEELVHAAWADIAAAVGAAGTAGAAATASGVGKASAGAASVPASAAVAGKVTLLKALAIGAAVGVVTAGGAVALTTPLHPRAAPSAAPVQVAPPEQVSPRETNARTRAPMPLAGEPRAADVVRIPASPRPPAALPPSEPSEKTSAVAAYGEAAAEPATDAARLEAQRVGVARDALKRHDAQGALTVLEDTARRFPSGILLQEREALSISALAALGRNAEASARARAFLRNFPKSPHSDRVRSAVGDR